MVTEMARPHSISRIIADISCGGLITGLAWIRMQPIAATAATAPTAMQWARRRRPRPNNVSSFTTTNEGDGSTGAVEVPDDGSISAALKTGRSLDGNDVTLQLQTSGAETRPKNKSVLFIIKY